MNKDEINNDIEEKVEVLNWMVKNNVIDVDDAGFVVAWLPFGCSLGLFLILILEFIIPVFWFVNYLYPLGRLFD